MILHHADCTKKEKNGLLCKHKEHTHTLHKGGRAIMTMGLGARTRAGWQPNINKSIKIYIYTLYIYCDVCIYKQYAIYIL